MLLMSVAKKKAQAHARCLSFSCCQALLFRDYHLTDIHVDRDHDLPFASVRWEVHCFEGDAKEAFYIFLKCSNVAHSPSMGTQSQ
jgi:hypothetical protein